MKYSVIFLNIIDLLTKLYIKNTFILIAEFSLFILLIIEEYIRYIGLVLYYNYINRLLYKRVSLFFILF
jgi:hypothetical protein